MKALRIRDWDKHYENNRSRELRRPEWLPLPNRFDGAGYMELCDHPAGMSHYGAWCMLLAAASRMPTRGLLVGDSGRPYTAKDLARMTRGTLAVFEEAIPRLLAIGWVEEVEVATPPGQTPSGEWRPPAAASDGAGIPQDGAAKSQDDAESLRLKGKGKGKGNLNGDGAVAAAVPRAATATAAKARRVTGVDAAAARRAIEQGDLIGVVRAYGGNLKDDRGAEWARDCHGITVHTVAVVLGWQLYQRTPVREPSGFRAAWARWTNELTNEYRRTLSIEVLAKVGLEVQVRDPQPTGAA